jgi:hypothetical protein
MLGKCFAGTTLVVYLDDCDNVSYEKALTCTAIPNFGHIAIIACDCPELRLMRIGGNADFRRLIFRMPLKVQVSDLIKL